MTGDRRTPTLRADLIAGAIYALIFAFLVLGPGQRMFYGLDAAYFDRLAKQQAGTPDSAITIVAIDEESVRNIGRFPFSRDVIASVIDTLATGGATTVVSTLAFSEPQVDAGADYLRDLDRTLAELEADPATLETLKAQVAGAITAIDYDHQLATSVGNAGNVLLPILMNDRRAGSSVLAGADPADLSTFGLDPWFATRSPRVDTATFPLPALSSSAAGLGHLAFFADHDGITRDLPLVMTYRDTALPALALVAALRKTDLSIDNVTVGKLPTMDVGPFELPMGESGRLLMRFYPGDGTPVFRTESFYDVFTGIVPAASFRGQTVLIGATAAGIGDALATPAGDATPPVELLAHAISTLSQRHYFTGSGYASPLILTLFGAIWLFIVFGLPRLGAVAAALISLSLVGALLFGEAMWLSGYGQWLTLVAPALFLVGGHLVMTVRRFGLTERLKLQTEAASAESNRMLGLAFQNQGQLDMAFEKFRRCPLDDSLMEPLYNLALDYERKRQFNKAGAVYMRMAEHDPKYRDIDARLKRNERLDETLVVGAGGSSGAQLFLDDDDSVQKPMLGRYVVEKELGKGAMGTVYLGRDPKINRVVAIKTIALSQEFDENEVASVRERFFREAETAGRLNHPDIVTVYDAGEEHDLAYIAMEFLKGAHLNGYTRHDALLPDDKVVELVARVADALAYAHREDVVHRDIKPANIMYHPESGDLKITDFGIARITSSSKTKTGIVLGTPSYMSPEQLAGKNVTGRSDLFSLGVTLYQLLAGQLPFRADSMATLMYKIANEPHTPLSVVRPELPPCLEAVVDRALAKPLEERYESGAQMALELRECRAALAA